MDSGRQYQNSAVRVRSPPPCRAIFFCQGQGLGIEQALGILGKIHVRGRSDHTHVRRTAGGNRRMRMPWKCPYTSGQSFGHGPRQSEALGNSGKRHGTGRGRSDHTRAGRHSGGNRCAPSIRVHLGMHAPWHGAPQAATMALHG